MRQVRPTSTHAHLYHIFNSSLRSSVASLAPRLADRERLNVDLTQSERRERFDSTWRAREIDQDSTEGLRKKEKSKSRKSRSRKSRSLSRSKKEKRYRHHHSHENLSTTDSSLSPSSSSSRSSSPPAPNQKSKFKVSDLEPGEKLQGVMSVHSYIILTGRFAPRTSLLVLRSSYLAPRRILHQGTSQCEGQVRHQGARGGTCARERALQDQGRPDRLH